MDSKYLDEKWKTLSAAGGRNRSLRIDSKCLPDLFLGVDDGAVRSLILKLPDNHGVDFQSTEKANLSIQLYPDSNWIVLKLLDPGFADLFNDLIVSIYNKIAGLKSIKDASSGLLTAFYKWSDFFTEKDSTHQSEESIRAIFGELLVLRERLLLTEASLLNDVLASWKDPRKNKHDFITGHGDAEVRTIYSTDTDVFIASEYQLAEEAGRPLELSVVTVTGDEAGLSIRDMVLIIRELVIGQLADFTIVLKALTVHGLSTRYLGQYDDHRYTPVSIDTYDCVAVGFPRIIRQGLPDAINKLSYRLRVASLAPFLKSSKPITQWE